MAKRTYKDIYEYDIELYYFITQKYKEEEEEWKWHLYANSYIDPDGYSGLGVKDINGIKCSADGLLSIRRIYAMEKFGEAFIETFKLYRKTPIIYFPSESGGINQSRGMYLEDRIDHTLLDLKNYCEGKEGCVLENAYKKPKTAAWLESFDMDFSEIAKSMNLVGSFVNDKYEIFDLEKSDGSVLKSLKQTYVRPQSKSYLDKWSEDYYGNLKTKIKQWMEKVSNTKKTLP